uniref:Uncharacterized protein n=1 Tax=viral metagenome TaxID=1070528 RepID=A0A6M3KC99_9ZZZZ
METAVLKNLSGSPAVMYFGSLVILAFVGLQIYKTIQEIEINKQQRLLNDLQIEYYAGAQPQ